MNRADIDNAIKEMSVADLGTMILGNVVRAFKKDTFRIYDFCSCCNIQLLKLHSDKLLDDDKMGEVSNFMADEIEKSIAEIVNRGKRSVKK